MLAQREKIYFKFYFFVYRYRGKPPVATEVSFSCISFPVTVLNVTGK